MTVTSEEAIEFLTEAGVGVHAPEEGALPITRAVICRTLMELCHGHDPRLPLLRWDTPIGAHEAPEACDTFGLRWRGSDDIVTFGDLVLYIEERLRDVWRLEGVKCRAQPLFYEIRRSIEQQSAFSRDKLRIRPRTRLTDCLPAGRSEFIVEVLSERHNVFGLPTEFRVFGKMEFGATWLALWVPVVLYLCVIFGDTGLSRGWFLVPFFGSALLVALALRLISWRVWRGVKTVGDLTRWLLSRHDEHIADVRRAIQELP